MSDDIIGIDLGTTNSMAAFFFEHGDKTLGAEVLEDSQLSSWQPSVVLATGKEFVVGKEAAAKKIFNPKNCFYSFKPMMGKKYKDFITKKKQFSYPIYEGEKGELLLGEQKFFPEELSAEILKKIKRIAEILLKKEIKKAVITVPAYFDEVQRQATKQATKIANLEIVRMINEPTAAAIAYGLDQKQNKKVVVYDFGGGTFDVSILEFKNKIFRVLATHGNSQLGGDDIDQSLVDYLVIKYFKEQLIDEKIKNYLKQIAEEAKIIFSSHLEYRKELTLFSKKISFYLKRKEFNEIIFPLVAKTLHHTKMAIKDAGLEVGQIDDVVLVGGSTKIALVREQVTHFFNKGPHLKIDPDRVVAIGAAMQGHLLTGKSKDFLLVDVIPLSLGIETLNGVFSKLILKNSSIPCKAQETFSTQKDNQSAVAINIFQGERELVKDCRFLGQFILRGIPPMPAGLARIEVEFFVDTNGLLKVSAKEMRSGIDALIEVIPDQGLTKEQIDNIVENSIIYAEQDFKESRLQEFSYQAKNILSSLEKSWDEASRFFNRQDLQKISEKKELLKVLLLKKDPFVIKQTADELGQLTTEFANYLVEQHLKNASSL